MGMTITEKIIAAHSGHQEISAGQFVYADVDICLGNDITAPIAIEQFEALGMENVFNPDSIVLGPDHFTPNKDINSAQNSKLITAGSKTQCAISVRNKGTWLRCVVLNKKTRGHTDWRRMSRKRNL